MRDPTDDLTVLMPVFNDWKSVATLLPELSKHLAASGLRATILLIDDRSTERDFDLGNSEFPNISRVEVLRLWRNLGHQRAIAIGLHFLSQREPRAVVVMDADGQDAPEDLPRLYARARETQFTRVVFAQRLRRSENLLFITYYHLYRYLHLALTGRAVKVGNFSLIPGPLLNPIVAISELWNHYSASVFKARMPVSYVPADRAPRLEGNSKMNFTSLVVHGLSALSVEGERVGVRLLTASFLLSLVALVVLVGGAVGFFALHVPIPLPVALISLFATLLLFNCQFAALLFTFAILNSRNVSSFLLSRDGPHFVQDVEVVYPVQNQLAGD